MSDDPEQPGWAAPGGGEPPRDPWGNPMPPSPPPPSPQPPAYGTPPGEGVPEWERPLSQWGSAPGAAPQWGAPQWGAPGPLPNATTEGTAIGALVCAIVGMCVCGVVLEPVAVVLGISARRKIRESNGALKGDGLALAAIVVGIIGFVLSIISAIYLAANPDFFDQLTSTTR